MHRIGLRSHRTGMISTAAIGAFSGMLQSLGFQAVVGNSESARQQFGLQMQLLGRQLSYLIPLPVHPETLAGYVQWRAFGFFPVIFGFWGLIAGSGVIRGDEDRGLLELWLATGTSRARLVAARAGAFIIALGAAILFVLVLTGLGATIVGSTLPIEGLLADGAALLAITVACFAIALLIAQFVDSRRVAAGSSCSTASAARSRGLLACVASHRSITSTGRAGSVPAGRSTGQAPSAFWLPPSR